MVDAWSGGGCRLGVSLLEAYGGEHFDRGVSPAVVVAVFDPGSDSEFSFGFGGLAVPVVEFGLQC